MAQKVNDIGATAKAALNKQIDAFARLNSQYDSQSEKIDALKRKIAGYSDEYGEMQAKIDETVKKLNDLEMMQGVIKDAVKDSAKRGTTFDTTQYKWVQEDIFHLSMILTNSQLRIRLPKHHPVTADRVVAVSILAKCLRMSR